MDIQLIGIIIVGILICLLLIGFISLMIYHSPIGYYIRRKKGQRNIQKLIDRLEDE